MNGPAIDADACQRCGACSAVSYRVLQRSFLSDYELWNLVGKPAAQRPARLTLTYGHGSPARHYPEDWVASENGVIRLQLPCVQLVSDDILLLAIAAGARTVVVQPDPECPHKPHVAPRRAIEAVVATLEALGLEGGRVRFGDEARVEEAKLDCQPAIHTSDFLALGNRSRVKRRATVVASLAKVAHRVQKEVSTAVVWREPVVHRQRCTVCGSCTYGCPTGAFRIGPDGGTLLGSTQYCIGCTWCENACPEDAVTRRPTVPTEPAVRVIVSQPMGKCVRCGVPIGTEPAVARVEQILAKTGHPRSTTTRL